MVIPCVALTEQDSQRICLSHVCCFDSKRLFGRASIKTMFHVNLCHCNRTVEALFVASW